MNTASPYVLLECSYETVFVAGGQQLLNILKFFMASKDSFLS